MRFTLAWLLAVAGALHLTACAPEPFAARQTETGVAARLARSKPPNIVLILADDLGVNDVSLNASRAAGGNAPPIRTPNIDRIASGGADFRRAYATNATCAPSRAALMTGRYQQRFGFEFNEGGGPFARILGTRQHFGLQSLYFPEREATQPSPNDRGLPVGEITIAQALKSAGYRTAHFGKWHLGDAPQFRPEARGFDLSVRFPGGVSRFAPAGATDVVETKLNIDKMFWDAFPYMVLRNGAPVTASAYQTDLWADEAISFMTSDLTKPFFAYVAFNAPHNPLQAPKAIYEEVADIRDPTARIYYAMVLSLDRAVGRILDALDRAGIADNTIVVFASDNGGADYTELWTHNLPFRGFKGSFWEGGVRTPLFVRWPAVIEPGTAYAAPVSLLDLFPTFVSAARGEMPNDRAYDGRSLWPYLEGKSAQAPHSALFWRAGETMAVRDGTMKLMIAARPAPGRTWLYDLAADPTEQHNLAASRPAEVARLRALLDAHFAGMSAPTRLPAYEMPIRADPPDANSDPAKIDYLYFPG